MHTFKGKGKEIKEIQTSIDQKETFFLFSVRKVKFCFVMCLTYVTDYCTRDS